MWIALAVTLVAGGVVVGSLAGTRWAVAEELQSANERWNALQQESQEQPELISELKEDRKDRLALRRECFVVVLVQIATLNELVGAIPSRVSSPSQLDPYSDSARELLLAFRQLLSSCEGG
jgi:hypothetical protein